MEVEYKGENNSLESNSNIINVESSKIPTIGAEKINHPNISRLKFFELLLPKREKILDINNYSENSNNRFSEIIPREKFLKICGVLFVGIGLSEILSACSDGSTAPVVDISTKIPSSKPNKLDTDTNTNENGLVNPDDVFQSMLIANFPSDDHFQEFKSKTKVPDKFTPLGSGVKDFEMVKTNGFHTYAVYKQQPSVPGEQVIYCKATIDPKYYNNIRTEADLLKKSLDIAASTASDKSIKNYILSLKDLINVFDAKLSDGTIIKYVSMPNLGVDIRNALDTGLIKTEQLVDILKQAIDSNFQLLLKDGYLRMDGNPNNTLLLFNSKGQLLQDSNKSYYVMGIDYWEAVNKTGKSISLSQLGGMIRRYVKGYSQDGVDELQILEQLIGQYNKDSNMYKAFLSAMQSSKQSLNSDIMSLVKKYSKYPSIAIGLGLLIWQGISAKDAIAAEVNNANSPTVHTEAVTMATPGAVGVNSVAEALMNTKGDGFDGLNSLCIQGSGIQSHLLENKKNGINNPLQLVFNDRILDSRIWGSKEIIVNTGLYVALQPDGTEAYYFAQNPEEVNLENKIDMSKVGKNGVGVVFVKEGRVDRDPVIEFLTANLKFNQVVNGEKYALVFSDIKCDPNLSIKIADFSN